MSASNAQKSKVTNCSTHGGPSHLRLQQMPVVTAVSTWWILADAISELECDFNLLYTALGLVWNLFPCTTLKKQGYTMLYLYIDTLIY